MTSTGSAARRKLDSPLFGHDDFRQIDVSIGQSSSVISSNLSPLNAQHSPVERKSVFERLGPAPVNRGPNDNRRTTVSQYEDEIDLRFKVRRSRKPLSPQEGSSTNYSSSSLSPQNSAKQKTLFKFDDNKVKSLITTPKEKKEKNNNLRNSKDIFDSLNNEEDDVDDEELKLKLQELQRELRELDNRNDHDDISKSEMESVQTMQLIVSNACVRSRSTSLVSSESGSCSSSKSNCSFSESKPIHHKNSTFKSSSASSVNKDKNNINHVNYQLSHVSSSTNVNNNNNNNSSGSIRKLDNVSVETKRSNEVKLDRHGNVRVSLVEQERQKRLRAERFRFNSNLDKSRKRTADQIEVSSID